jgi:hypothetical protein
MKKVKSRRAPATATRQPAANRKRSGNGERPAVGKAAGRKAAKRPKQKSDGARGRTAAKPAVTPKPAFQIRELDPLRICGDRTSVVQLFRVDEQLVGGKAAGARQVHLVFNDRHGWYCEHGRSCHAVSAVMRHARIR